MAIVVPDFSVFLKGEGLTDPQIAAAMDLRPQVQAIACAGSGKSKTLAFRIAHLLHIGVAPEAIVAFTFTVKAAEALKLRIAKALLASGQDPMVIGRMFVGTIDAFAKMVLGSIDARYRQFDEVDPNKLVLYLMSRYPELNIKQFRQRTGRNGNAGPYFATIEKLAHAWEAVQNENISIDDVRTHDPELATLLETLGAALDRDQYVDFAFTSRKVADAYADPAVRERLPHVAHLLVDEYQDVNHLQDRLVTAIHDAGAGIFVVGDDDQSIYGFRGADVQNILTFQQRYPDAGVHELSENFRSTKPIVELSSGFAQAVLGANRLPKSPTAHADPQPQDAAALMFGTVDEEAEWVASRIEQLLGTEYREGDTVRGLTFSDFAVLMKSTKRGDNDDEAKHRPFTEALSRHGIVSVVESTGDLFDRPYARMLRSAFRLLAAGPVNRTDAATFFDADVLPLFGNADRTRFYDVLTRWANVIHAPRGTGGARRRVYPQQLLQDLLESFAFATTQLEAQAYYDLGTVSRILQDVETVFPSIDGKERFGLIVAYMEQSGDGAYEPNEGEVGARQDAVFVSTIHKAKGLEFPVVFVVDARQSQIPGSEKGYDGLLPAALMAPAIARGSYVNSKDSAARVFYTAITRAERYLYVTASKRTPRARMSDFALRLRDLGANDDPAAVATPPPAAARRPREDEDALPTTFSELRYFLRCPYDYKMRKVFGFSPPISEMFGFGQSVHTTVGKIHEEYPDTPPTQDEAALIAEQTFHLKHVRRSTSGNEGPFEQALEATKEIARKYVRENAADFPGRKRVEARFEIPVEQAVITGSIDLLVRRDDAGRVVEAEVVDFKAMKVQNNLEDRPLEDISLPWEELTLQVQLYVHAANEVLGENASSGQIHLLKDGTRVAVPVDDGSLKNAVQIVEWAVARIADDDFPRRPSKKKCENCDFEKMCSRNLEQFKTTTEPPTIQMPGGERRKMGCFAVDANGQPASAP